LTESIDHPRAQKGLAADGSLPSRVECQNTEVLADAHFRYELLTLRTELFSGKMSPTYKREVLRSGQAVVVLLYDPRVQKLILIEQFRIGAYVNHLASSWIIECVAGMVDEGESKEEAARREAKEETNCDVGQLQYIGSYLSSPGLLDEMVSLYVGEVDATRAGGIHGHMDEGEDIRTLILGVDEVLQAMDSGAIVNIMAQTALLWFARHEKTLRQQWLGL
jgi:ADP-ribose pyrophosphatase